MNHAQACARILIDIVLPWERHNKRRHNLSPGLVADLGRYLQEGTSMGTIKSITEGILEYKP